MMVVFVSQCEKKALNRTRRVLDAFANRIGDNTWQTVITEEGLLAVRKLLRKTASKSTAVSCHWLRSRSRSELLWVVGNRKKFNEQGVVPVNYTEGDVEQYMDKGKWQRLALMCSAVEIAGLYHDFGKANILFQAKLRGEGKNKYEPIRHEWVSLRLFQAFVGGQTDKQWLESLTNVGKGHIDEVFKDGISEGKSNPLADLPPFAQLVGWLIVSHHKLPVVPAWKETLKNHQETKPAELRKNNMSPQAAWFERELAPHWNSYNFMDEDSPEFYQANWTFHQDGLPYASYKWRLKVMATAGKALTNVQQISTTNLVHDDLFTSHLSRMALMLADHHYSSLEEITENWRSPDYAVYANTDRETKKLKQQLDEHLIGVAQHAAQIISALPRLKNSLNAIEDNAFLQNTKITNSKFAWQINAQKEAKNLSASSEQQGFFGINMASTGKGKTLANAKIMYALASEKQNCRFSVALGLRTLTLQTGKEYRNQLDLTDEQLAIAVGGAASKALFENEQCKRETAEDSITGSASAEEYLDADIFLDFAQDMTEHSLHEWTSKNERIEKLLQAPALVCTIDHLIPATDGTTGGKQIGPMLRLLTSDLVIDEPDDFGLEDLPALCRLVYWAGMLGSRVLLSTATMPPDLAFAAFQAYQAGWQEYAKVNISNWSGVINCAWFDEREKGGALAKEIHDFNSFKTEHEKYVAKRVEFLTKTSAIKHKGEILNNLNATDNIYSDFSKTILQGALQLHKNNQVEVNGKRVSIGLVRVANINPLVAVAKNLVQQNLPENTHIHLCVYHSRFPLAVRSHLESHLDRVLNRKDYWPPQDLEQTIENTQAENQIFIVLASPVAEVGRDHDYDWAIIEPSSMRSIIQIAGRVLRHRDIAPQQENILLLNKNINALKGMERCFTRPGFEAEHLKLKLNSHQLVDILEQQQYQQINAVERVMQTRQAPEQNLVALEHKALVGQLFAGQEAAKLWWKEQAHWCAVLQKIQPFRKSAKDEALFLLVENDELSWQWKNEAVYPAKMGSLSGAGIQLIQEEAPKLATGFSFWFNLEPVFVYKQLAEDFDLDIEKVSLRFGELRLVSYNKNDLNEYKYFNNLGVYQEVK